MVVKGETGCGAGVGIEADAGLRAGEAARPKEDEPSIFTYISMSVISD
jgi:hypothetical protein